jgi:hypothetical protein
MVLAYLSIVSQRLSNGHLQSPLKSCIRYVRSGQISERDEPHGSLQGDGLPRDYLRLFSGGHPPLAIELVGDRRRVLYQSGDWRPLLVEERVH